MLLSTDTFSSRFLFPSSSLNHTRCVLLAAVSLRFSSFSTSLLTTLFAASVFLTLHKATFLPSFSFAVASFVRRYESPSWFEGG